LATDQIDHDLLLVPVGHVDQLHFGQLLEQLARQVLK